MTYTSEKSKQIALARLDLIHKWLEFRKKSQNKLQADYDFVKLHNSSNSHLFEILGKISRGSLHRWYAMLDGTEDYTKLLPQYKYSKVDEYRTVLTDEEIKIFMSLLLCPNRISIGKATALTKYKLKEQGQNFIPADITFKRYAKWFKDNNYDKWVLARDGEKVLSDKVEPYIKRDASLLEVGDILVADGHKLAFQVINPFTGKPCRATLVGFLDWKSTALVGYEIMLEENTQCIASALRNAIINLDMIPKVVYQDNGRAFRAKYFTDDRGFTELGFYGLYSKLGIETVFARPYNARAKVIERFFKEFQEGFEKLLPSYIGSSIESKPAYMMRNEKFHKKLHNEFIPTIEETIKMIDMWLNFKNSQPCPNAPDKTIAEVLEERKRQNINLARHLKEFTLDEIEMIAECDCKTELERLLNGGKIIFEQDLYKYVEKTLKVDFGIFITTDNNQNLRFEEAVNTFIDNYAKRHCKKRTYETYESIFKVNITPFFRNHFLNDIIQELVIEFYRKCKSRQLGTRRLKNTMTLLNQLIKYFQNLGIIERTCNFQVRRLTDKNKFSINRIIFEE